MSVLWLFVGAFLGMAMASLISAAAQADRCHECWLRERERHG
jgi:hypothetical protein